MLSKYGIDPVNDHNSLMWAPNRGHSVANARTVASRLEAADTRISAQNMSSAEGRASVQGERQRIGQEVFGWK